MTSLASLDRHDAGAPAQDPQLAGGFQRVAAGIVIGEGARRVTILQIVSFHIRGGMIAARRVFGAWQNRRSVRQLLEMDDYQLADIGLRRSDVHDSLALALRDDPSVELTRRRLQRRSNERAQLAEFRSSAAKGDAPPSRP